jgi:hypothetical protein
MEKLNDTRTRIVCNISAVNQKITPSAAGELKSAGSDVSESGALHS